MIKPYHTLLFLLAVGALCVGLMHVVPEDGFKVGSIEIRYPTWESFVSNDTAQKVDVEAIMRAGHMTRLDTAGQAQTERERKARERLMRTLQLRKLQFAEGDNTHLSKLREALSELGDTGKLRVLHYGDSQIEGDRITSLLRREWSERYGGEGPGMLDAVPLAPSFSIEQSHSHNWQRYTAFGKRDTNIHHTNFGLRAVLCRYTAPGGDTTASDTTMGWLEFKPSNRAYRSARNFHQMKLYYGNVTDPFRLKVFVNDTLFTEQIIQTTQAAKVRTWNFTSTPQKIRMEFVGKVSPDVYGISLEGRTGVVVDNIPMRGASGVVFTRMSSAHLLGLMEEEPVGLILFQYGGNTVPYIRDEDHAKEYARRVRRQIQKLKRLAPNATIIMIGPSDMSEKEGTKFVTYDAVPWVRSALRQVAMDEKVAFWDIFGAMGGLNSMPEWVKTDPPLAGPDHVHFTPRGAREVGEWLVNAMRRELYHDFEETSADSTLLPSSAQ